MSKNITRVLSLLSIASFLGHLMLYPNMPRIVPIHWNADGRIDGWGPKWVLLMLSALPMFMLLLFWFAPKLDPRRKNHQKHSKAYSLFTASITGLLIATSWAITLLLMGVPMPISSCISVMVGIFFIITGNYMPQVRSNFFFGIKTPWAIENEVVWRKTHRLAGVLYCVGGVIIIISSFLPGKIMQWGILPIILMISAIPYLYSYIIYRKISNH